MADDRSLGERELDVMAVLWARGSGTVGEVQRRLGVKLAYTAVLTILRNLEAKKFLRHEEEGRAHRYFARVQQGTAQKSALTRLIDTLFHGSPEALIARHAARGRDDPCMDAGGHLLRAASRCGRARAGVGRAPALVAGACAVGRGAGREPRVACAAFAHRAAEDRAAFDGRGGERGGAIDRRAAAAASFIYRVASRYDTDLALGARVGAAGCPARSRTAHTQANFAFGARNRDGRT